MSLLKFAAATAGLAASLVSATHYEVTVGKGGQLRFEPEQLTATIGDTVTYKFFARVRLQRKDSLDSKGR